MAPPLLPRLLLVPPLLAFALGGAVIVAWASLDLVNALTLRQCTTQVEAQVTDSRILRSMRAGTSYELRYHFILDGQTYSHRDATGRKGLWASVATQSQWQAARGRGRIAVRYDPKDPWVNRPTDAGAMPLGDPAAGMGLGLLVALSGLILAGRVARHGPAALRPRSRSRIPV